MSFEFNSTLKSEAPRPQGGASRRGSFLRIVPLDPAYPPLAGRGSSRSKLKSEFFFQRGGKVAQVV